MFLFLSVDIEGSTKFKSSTHGGPSTWGPFFLEFFENFPAKLKERETDIARTLGLVSDAPFELWKTLGDELLFYKKLDRGLSLFCGALAASRALIKGAELLRQHGESRTRSGESDHYPTQLKGTAWIAGFPIKNMIVGSNPKEYIGPAIDLGFRLAKLSSPTRMVVSAPLAWMINKIQYAHTAKLNGFTLDFFYFGRETLKGVGKDGTGYPVFWVDASDAAKVSTQEKDIIRRGKLAPKDVVEFCESLFSDTASGIGQPFILGDKDGIFEFPHHKSKVAKQYVDDYKAFLTTVPAVVADPPTSGNGKSGDPTKVLSAIKLVATKKPTGSN